MLLVILILSSHNGIIGDDDLKQIARDQLQLQGVEFEIGIHQGDVQHRGLQIVSGAGGNADVGVHGGAHNKSQCNFIYQQQGQSQGTIAFHIYPRNGEGVHFKIGNRASSLRQGRRAETSTQQH
ncbi:MAG: hypothetical protein MK319_13755 [Pseudomonadales bacterium]|jgi:hypothetical protein|nr:hypothetical protein [Pseudomonadales bacterium]